MDTACPYLEWGRLALNFRFGCEVAEVALVYRAERRLFLIKEEFYLTRRPVSVLFYQYLGDAGSVGIIAHLIFSMDEHDDIRVLFERARIAQVGKARATASLLNGTGKLGKGEYGNIEFA